MKIVIELRHLQLHSDITVNKLKQGYGESVVLVLNRVAKMVVSKMSIKLKKPVFKNEELSF